MKKYPKIVIALTISVLSALVLVPELLFGGGSGMMGSDFLFHLTRYTDAAMQIKTGHFSYFQQFFTYNFSGKIVNALYGPLNAYLQGAILLLVGFKTELWYPLYLWLINVAGLSSMFYLLRQLKVLRGRALVLGMIFITTGSVTSNIDVGMYAIGYAFLPIVVSAAIRLLRDKEQPVKLWELVIGFTLLAQTHMLTLALGVIIYGFSALTYLGLVFLKKRSFGLVFLPELKAGFLVLLLNFNIWGGYLEVMQSSNPLVMPFQGSTLYWPSAISFTSLNFGNISGFVVLMVIVVVVLLLQKIKQTPAWVRFAGVMMFFFGLIAFGILPLTFIPAITIFQFSSRFMAVALILALALVGAVWERRKSQRWLTLVVVVTTILTVGLYAVNTAINAQAFELDRSVSTANAAFKTTADRYAVLENPQLLVGDHLPALLKGAPSGSIDYIPDRQKGMQNQFLDPNIYPYFYNDILATTDFRGSDLKRSVTNDGLTLTWESAKAQETLLPVLTYGHTQLVLNGKKLSASDFRLSYIGATIVRADKGKNVLTVSYQPARWFVGGVFCQLIGGILVFLFVILKRRKDRRN